eukprot:GHVN01073965.1.p2 GENE.GHVN01073965.1~~GHVN01073965.1.p2  ORF type:complete len:128 (+),score=14.37 GHVN01073965.1:66-449(+)
MEEKKMVKLLSSLFPEVETNVANYAWISMGESPQRALVEQVFQPPCQWFPKRALSTKQIQTALHCLLAFAIRGGSAAAQEGFGEWLETLHSSETVNRDFLGDLLYALIGVSQASSNSTALSNHISVL